MMTDAHTTVMQRQAVDALVWDVDQFYVDGTFGRGGHSRAILERLSDSGRLMAFDLDPQAIASGQVLAAEDHRFAITHASFQELDKLPSGAQLAGLLLDLGVSSPQLDDVQRGFSFMRNGPLDMRMDTSQGQSAAQWLAGASATELEHVLREFGEERYAKRIAAAIVASRAENEITETAQLADIVKAAHPRWEKNQHPATRSFQGIRIFINGELQALKAVLDKAVELLVLGGRLVVISFHSLEDRIVKRFIRHSAHEVSVAAPRHIPLRDEPKSGPRLRALGKAQRCSTEEINSNRRARSAIMRVAERVA